MNIFKQIRRSIVSEGKLKKYLMYAAGEIFLVVVGILIALQINNWNNNRMLRQQELKLYENIRRQVQTDRKEIVNAIGFNVFFSKAYQNASRIILTHNKNKIDSLALMAMWLSQYSDFHRSGNIYENMVNSGDIKLITNDSISNSIQTLEMTYNNIDKLENVHWTIIMQEVSPQLKGIVNYATLKPVEPLKLYDVTTQNLFIECLFLTKAKDSIYSRTLSEIDLVTTLIDKELKPAQIP